MMYEKKEGSRSFWAPYIKELDRQRGRGQQGAESPILWPEDEVKNICVWNDSVCTQNPMYGMLTTKIVGS